MKTVDVAAGIIFQLMEVLNRIDQEKYTQKLEIISNATLGEHIRHILDFFICLRDSEFTQTVNYDLRARNVVLETNLKRTIQEIHDIIKFLSRIDPKRIIDLEGRYGNQSFKIQTSFQREIIYNIEHAIHHLALIRIAINFHFPEITLPENFGIADSTIRFRQQQMKTS
jgi:hypothetical protein